MPDLHEDEPYTPRGHVAALAETDDRLLFLLQVAGNEWGPLGVALTAALMADPDAVVQSLVAAGSAQPIGRKRLRAILAGRVGMPRRPDVQAFVDLDLRTVRGGVQYPSLADGPVEVEYGKGGQRVDSIEAPRLLDLGQHPLALRVYGPGLVTFDGRVLRVEYDEGGYEVTAAPDPREWVSTVEANRVLAEERAAHARHLAEWEERSRQGRQQVDRLVASNDDLRGQVAHLTDERDDARSQLVTHAREAEQLAEGLRAERDALREQLAQYRASFDPAAEETSPHPIAEDPRRPSLDHYPEDAILLTYREVRQLVGTHLEACASSSAPADAARAMREGETPLRLAEVLDR